MKNAVVKVDIIIEIDGNRIGLTTHIEKDSCFELDTEKYPNAKLIAIRFKELKLIF